MCVCQLEADEASETEGSLADELDSPLWALYTFVAHYKNAAGQLMSEPFNRMPNRKFYPDYYDEIETPISLLKIKTKIRVRQNRAMSSTFTGRKFVIGSHCSVSCKPLSDALLLTDGQVQDTLQ